MHEGPEVGGRRRLVEVGVVEHHERRLAAELEQDRLEVLRRLLGDDSADLVEPVKLIRRTRGSAMSASTVAAGALARVVSTLMAPAGSPASSSTSPMTRWVCGHSSDALRTTVLPHASGIATARTPRIIGAFHGAMPSTTPTGWRTDNAMLPGMSEGITSPVIWVVAAAASRIMLAANAVLNIPHPKVAPVSAVIVFAMSGARPSSRSAAFHRIARRFDGGVFDHSAKAAAAAPAAAAASSGPASGTRATSSPGEWIAFLVVAAVG